MKTIKGVGLAIMPGTPAIVGFIGSTSTRIEQSTWDHINDAGFTQT